MIFLFFPAGFSVATIFNIQLFINGFIERLQNEIPSFLGGENALFKNNPVKSNTFNLFFDKRCI